MLSLYEKNYDFFLTRSASKSRSLEDHNSAPPKIIKTKKFLFYNGQMVFIFIKMKRRRDNAFHSFVNSGYIVSVKISENSPRDDIALKHAHLAKCFF